MKFLKKEEKILLGLLFISLIVLVNQLVAPHFLLTGAIFLDGITAFLINIFFISISILTIFILLKKIKTDYLVTKIAFGFLAINSAINLLSSYIFKEDIKNFIASIHGTPELFAGFVINQSIILLISICTIIAIFSLKKA